MNMCKLVPISSNHLLSTRINKRANEKMQVSSNSSNLQHNSCHIIMHNNYAKTFIPTNLFDEINEFVHRHEDCPRQINLSCPKYWIGMMILNEFSLAEMNR